MYAAYFLQMNLYFCDYLISRRYKHKHLLFNILCEDIENIEEKCVTMHVVLKKYLFLFSEYLEYIFVYL